MEYSFFLPFFLLFLRKHTIQIQNIKLTEWTRNRAAVMEVRTLHNDNEMKIVRHYEHWMERYEDQYQDDDDQY